MCLSTATLGPCPKTCCRRYCQAHPRTDEGTEKQEKLCCRCRTAVVVVAPATRSSVGQISGCRFFVFKLRESQVGEPGNTQQNRERVQRSRVRPTSRACSDADPDLVCPTAAAAILLLEKFWCRCRTAALVVAPATGSSLCWTQHVRCRFFVLKSCRISRWGTRKHTTTSSICTKGSKVSLVCPAVVAAAAAIVAAAATYAAADDFFLLEKINPNVTNT